MLNGFLFALVITGYTAFLLYVIITIIINFKRKERDCRNPLAEAIMVFSEVLFTIIGPVIGFMRYDTFGPDIPFAKHHVLIIMLLVSSSSAAYWFSRFTMNIPNPLVRIIASAGLLQGIILCFITTIHFLPFFFLGVFYPMLGFELLSPLIALFLLSKQLYFYTRKKFDYSELLPYRTELGFVPVPVKIMESPASARFVVFTALVVLMIAVQVFFDYGCGHDPTSVIKAYTESHGFIFSN
ncbi:MAG: DUF6688 family protein [Bacteroidia bacterium]